MVKLKNIVKKSEAFEEKELLLNNQFGFENKRQSIKVFDRMWNADINHKFPKFKILHFVQV